MRLPRKGATAAVAVSAALLTGCSGDSTDIQTAAVGRSTVSEVVEAPATVQAAATTTLTSPATGEVEQVLVKDGQRVAAGTVLARISSPETTAQLTQARSALAQVPHATGWAARFASAAPGSVTSAKRFRQQAAPKRTKRGSGNPAKRAAQASAATVQAAEPASTGASPFELPKDLRDLL